MFKITSKATQFLIIFMIFSSFSITSVAKSNSPRTKQSTKKYLLKYVNDNIPSKALCAIYCGRYVLKIQDLILNKASLNPSQVKVIQFLWDLQVDVERLNESVLLEDIIRHRNKLTKTQADLIIQLLETEHALFRKDLNTYKLILLTRRFNSLNEDTKDFVTSMFNKTVGNGFYDTPVISALLNANFKLLTLNKINIYLSEISTLVLQAKLNTQQATEQIVSFIAHVKKSNRSQKNKNAMYSVQ